MADARTLTPRTYSRNMYVPENNPEFMAAQEERENSYTRFKRETIENTYKYVLEQTGSPEKAQDAAQSVARKMFRTEAIASVVAPEAALAGGAGALNMARAIISSNRAARTSEAPALLTGPRNAMKPEEMLAAEVETGPKRLTSGEFLPRIDIPRVQSSGITARDVVSSPFDDIGRMAGEGGLSDDAIAVARKMAQDRVAAEEAFRARQLAQMEGEGGSAAGEVLRQRGLRAAEDAALTARQMGTAEGEGMLTADAVQAARAMAQRRLQAQEAAQAVRLDRMADDGAGMAISGTPAPRASMPAVAERTQPGTGFTLGESSGSYSPNFTMPGASRTQAGSFGLPTTRGSSDVVGGFTPIAQGGYDVPAILRMLGGAGMGAGATASALNVARDMRGAGPSAAAPANVRPMDSTLFGEDTGRRLANVRPMDSTLFGENVPDRIGGAASYGSSDRTERARVSEPAPAAVSAAKTLWDAYNRSMMDEGGGRADLFALARRAEMEDQGRARGGAAKPTNGGKDAALHKALEIIHHMLVNR